MPRRSIEPLSKPLTIRLEPKQEEILRKAYPTLSLGAIIRQLVSKHIQALETKMAQARKALDDDLDRGD